MKLNLGSSTVHLTGYVNIDCNPQQFAGVKSELIEGWGPEVVTRRVPDRYMDVTKLDYKDNSIGEIRASHLLEHLPFHKAKAVLSEWYRVLEPAGEIKIIVPDFDEVMKRYNRKEEYKEFWESTMKDPGLCWGTEYHDGFKTEEQAMMTIFQCNGEHKSIWNHKLLKFYLQDVGFREVLLMPNEGIPDCSVIDYSLRVRGIKP